MQLLPARFAIVLDAERREILALAVSGERQRRTEENQLKQVVHAHGNCGGHAEEANFRGGCEGADAERDGVGQRSNRDRRADLFEDETESIRHCLR